MPRIAEALGGIAMSGPEAPPCTDRLYLGVRYFTSMRCAMVFLLPPERSDDCGELRKCPNVQGSFAHWFWL